MSYVMGQTSPAHVYGNVTSYITEFITHLFPENYFQEVIVNTAIPYRQLDRFRNSEEEYFRRLYPQVIIKPKIELNDTDTFLYGTYLTSRITDLYMDTSFTNLQPFMYDNERGNSMKYLLNRLKMSFDVTIVVETLIEQINQVHFLKNTVRQDHPFFMSTFLENYIPRELLELMGDDVGIPLYDDNGSVKPFLDYANGISEFPISYKLKNASGNDEFFRYYPANIDISFNGLNADTSPSEKKNWVDYSYNINFTVTAEFNSAGLYYYFAQNPEKIDGIVGIIQDKYEDEIIPFLTVSNIYTERYAEGWNLYASPMFRVEPNELVDVMDIAPLFNNSMKRIIDYHLEHGIPSSVYMKVLVLKNTELLSEPMDYEVDIKGLTLITKNIDCEATYRLIIHVNTIYINNLIKDIYNLDEER